MATNYPGSLDSYTTKQDNIDTVSASHINDLQDAVVALETKVGADSSAVTTSIDYLLKNTSSVDPGHHHTDTSIDSLAFSKLTFSGLTAGYALFADSATSATFRQIQESDIADGTIYPRIADSEAITGHWFLNNVGGFSFYDSPSSWKVDINSSGTNLGFKLADDYEVGWNNASTLSAGYIDLSLWRSSTSTLRVGDGTRDFTHFGILETKEVRIYKDLSINYTSFTFNGTANITYTLPSSAGSSGQFLQTDGFGNLSWVTSSATVTLDGVLAATAAVTRNHGNNTITWQWNQTIAGTGLDISGAFTGSGISTLLKLSANTTSSKLRLLVIDGSNLDALGRSLLVISGECRFVDSPTEFSSDYSATSSNLDSTYPIQAKGNSAGFRGGLVTNLAAAAGSIAGTEFRIRSTTYGRIGAYFDSTALEIRGDDTNTIPVYLRPGTTTTAKAIRNDSSDVPIFTVEQQGSGDCLFTIKRGRTEFFAGIDNAQSTDLIFGLGTSFLSGSQAQLRLLSYGNIASYTIQDRTTADWYQAQFSIEANPSAASTANFIGVDGFALDTSSLVNSLTALIGVRAQAEHKAASTATYTIGLDAKASTSGTSIGSVSNLVGIRTKLSNVGANMTVTNAYGILIESPQNTGTITNLWGLYQAGTEANYLRGALRIGSTAAAPTSGVGLQYDGILALQDGISAPSSSISGYAQIYIDSADGDLKIRFSDGVVKTIITDV